MTTTLKTPSTPIAQFRYSAASGSFTADISETNGFGRIFDDACDEGLTIIGATGREVQFVIEQAHRDREGDLTHWTLRSVDGRFTAVIFND